MKYGIVIDAADARTISELAWDAEQAGWDGVFVSDAIGVLGSYPWFDPWVALAAVAMRTERIRMGTLITPVSRRRPWKLARETTTLDQLSGGRLILGVGLGAAEHDGGFFKVGEQMELKARAKLMDEGLEIIAGLWKGKEFSFRGEHYNVDKLQMMPRPAQKPRIPIWIVGVWTREKSMSRAVKWDGVIPQVYKGTPASRVSPDETREIKAYVEKRRSSSDPFDIVVGGMTAGKSRKQAAEIVRPYSDAGATWWIESVFNMKKLRAHIKQGPPSVD